MKKLLLSSVAGLAISASSVLAADLPGRAPAVAPAPIFVTQNWSGFYIGAQAGWAGTDSHYTLNNGAGLIERFSHSPGSFIGGGHIGVQGQWGNIVLGLEGKYDYLHASSTNVSALAPPRRRSLSIDGIGSITGKIGYAFDNVLIYARGGFAASDIKVFAISPATGVSGGSRDWNGGWTVGAGIDYRLTQNWIAGVDVNYYNFKFNRTSVNTDGTIGRWTSTNANAYSVQLRLSYLFGSAPAAVVAKY